MPKKLLIFSFLFSFFLILSFIIPKTLAFHRMLSLKLINSNNFKVQEVSLSKISTPTPTKVRFVNRNFRKKVEAQEKPTSTFRPTAKPTSVPFPTKVPEKPKEPTTTPVLETQGSDIKTYIINEINRYRASQGLSGVSTDSYACAFAKLRAEEISKNFDHSGFSSRIDSKTLPYPSYSLITENIARNSDYKNVVQAWINSPSHAENMRKDTPNVCVEYYGNFYAYEGLKP